LDTGCEKSMMSIRYQLLAHTSHPMDCEFITRTLYNDIY